MNLKEFFNLFYLVDKLAAKEVTGWHAVVFLLAGNILYIIFSFITYYLFKFNISNNINTVVVENILLIAVTIYGIKACYRTYSENDFITLFIILTLPSMIYSQILSWVINFVIIYSVESYGDKATFNSAAEVMQSMERAGNVLEVGPIAASIISLVFFFYLINLGLKMYKSKSH